MTPTVTLSLEEFDRMRKETTELKRQISEFTRALKHMNGTSLQEYMEKFYDWETQCSKNNIRSAVMLGRL